MKLFWLLVLSFMLKCNSHPGGSSNKSENLSSLVENITPTRNAIQHLRVVMQQSIYDGCGDSKYCIGLPNGCVESENCVSFGAVIVKDGTYSFEMQTTDVNSYVALALSVDNLMRDSSAIECVRYNEQVQAYTSLLAAVPRRSASRSDSNQDIIRVKESWSVDGVFHCLVERDAVSQIGGLTFDLPNEAYYLLIATGTTVSETGISSHGSRVASSSSFRFIEEIPEETTTTETTTTLETTTIEQPNLEPGIYEDCGEAKYCIGLPIGCVESKTCVSFGAVIVKDKKYFFEMQTSDNNAYIALALSDDEFMGDSSAIECVYIDSQVQAYTSLLGANPRHSASRDDSDQSIIALRESKVENGVFSCLIERDVVSEVGGFSYDLENEAYYLLIATGAAATETGITNHGAGNRGASTSLIQFEEVPEDTTTDTSTTSTTTDGVGGILSSNILNCIIFLKAFHLIFMNKF